MSEQPTPTLPTTTRTAARTTVVKTEPSTIPSRSSASALRPAGKGFTLGGAQKLKFAPTVPTKRIQKTGPLSLLDEAKQVKKEYGKGKKPGMGRGRGRDFDSDLSTSSASGPFSLGPAAIGMRAGRPTFSGGGGGGGGGAGGFKPGGGTGVKREGGGGHGGYDEDDMDDDAIMFNDDLDMHAPMTLNANTKTNTKSGVKVKRETDAMGIQIGDDVDMEDEEEHRMEGVEHDNDYNYKLPLPAGALFETNHALPDDRLLFFQFPNIFPKLEATALIKAGEPEKTEVLDLDDLGSEGSTPSAEDNASATNPVAVKTEAIGKIPSTTTSSSSGPSSISVPSSSSAAASMKKEKAPAKVPLDGTTPTIPGQDPDGCIGMLQVYKSGKMRLRVGEIVMDITKGSECSFLQNVVVVDPTSREAFVMGNVEQRFVVQPNVKKLLRLC